MKFSVDLDTHALEVGNSCAVLRPRGRSWPHLTVHFAGNPAEDGRWTPHLTFSRWARRTLARVTEAQLRAFRDAVIADLHAHFMAATEPTTLDALEADGWVIYAPPADEAIAEAEQCFALSAQSYALTDERIRRFVVQFIENLGDRCVAAASLAEDPRMRLHVALRVTDDDDLEHCYVSRRHTPDDGLGEFQRTRPDAITSAKVEEAIARHGGVRLTSALERVTKALSPHPVSR